MSTLGKKLPNLDVLKLLKFACVGKCWKTSDEDFPQLKFLKLVTISIEEWQVSSNPFPRLQRLVLVRCWGLQSIPSEIGEVPTLQMIEVRDCNTSVANSAHKIKEEQNWLQIVESETGMTGMTRMTRSGGGGGLVWMTGINGSGLILKIGGEAKMSL
ncbi:putative late blight resistance protein homolog R1B-16 isoform X2 [Actinidia eriantha]|uniref:putative late blight resistance protein homolog R1B-16 isoform X2 n=1 Tax=Actinidia eriantha TaxID=165200 RepID=UPI00258FE8CF|nr:putative late blight resistance protein homolog R1B-16 isoform X2 [Actinidia eriantha]